MPASSCKTRDSQNWAAAVDPFLLQILTCPRDKFPLLEDGPELVCPKGHAYPVVDGVPILLLSEMEQTHIEGQRSLAFGDRSKGEQPPRFEIEQGKVDPFVRNAIGATNGALYQHLVGTLEGYPIPELNLPRGEGKTFLEIGCNWGRWCIAAARLGYTAAGVDPSLKSILAARRVAKQLGVRAHYVVADGRTLPFGDAAFDQIFSYSVLQHLSRENVRVVLGEIRRVLDREGGYQIQMPNALGLRCIYHQFRRKFREAEGFEVRYWTPRELVSVFGGILGSARMSVDGFFSLNAQISDLQFLPAKYRALVKVSHSLRKLSGVLPPLAYLADSLYLSAP